MAFKNDFTPDAGSSSYTLQNLESGESFKLRVMTEILTGYSLWSEEDGKPVLIRAEHKEEIDPSKASVNKLSGKKNKRKQFIACIVYNYDVQRFEVFETDKASIIKKLWSLDQDPDLGDLRQYDIKLKKTGQGMDTRYDVLSLGKAKIDKEIAKKFDELEFNLSALYDGGNPLDIDTAKIADEVAEAQTDEDGDVPF
jgi:hypothetical protein